MGAYLSEPITKKISSNEYGKNVAFGASSMQGWRVSQEDAHNCCIEFDENTSLFAVYDGHGGHEVATYCAKELPNFIKNTDAYKSGNIKQALIDAFLGFDAALTKPDIINVLKEIAGTNDNERDKGEVCGSGDDEESVSDLRMEAAMPLEQVMARYQTECKDYRVNKTNDDDEDDELCGRQTSVLNLYSRCRVLNRRGKEITTSRWPLGPGCSSSSSSWNADEQDVNSSSQACSSTSVLPNDNTEKRSASPNGLIDPDSSYETSIANATCKYENACVNDVNGEQKTKMSTVNAADSSKNLSDKVSSSSSGSLENGDSKQCDEVIGCQSTVALQPPVDLYHSLLQKGKETGRRKICVTNITQQDLDIDDDDDDDDDDENDETFDGSPIGCDDDTEDIDDDDDDDEEEEEDDDDEKDEDDSSEDEQDSDSKEADDDDGDFTMDMTEEPGSDSGCTAVVAILHERDLYVANAGDSRCVLCRDGEALELSLDHKPEDQPEMERIVKAGGKVTADGRVNGGLNLSRALGDHAYKQNTTLPAQEQMISALPDVRHIAIDPERDDFMILACDGIWNFMSSQEVVAFVLPRLRDVKEPNISKICEELFDRCLAPNTLGDGTGCDNMTAVIVKFNRVPSVSNSPMTNCIEEPSASVSKKRPISPSAETSDQSGKPHNSSDEECNSTTANSNESQSGDRKRQKTETV